MQYPRLKKCLAVTIFSLLGFCAEAQESVSIKVFPDVFDKLVYSICNSAGSVTPVDSGVMSYWDLSAFGVTKDTLTEEYLNVPAGDKTNHPAATVMVKRLAFTNTTKTFYKKDATWQTFAIVGWESQLSNGKHNYSVEKSVLQFPLVLKNSMENSFTYTYSNFGIGGTKIGTNKTTVPGYGRLKMPDGTIYDSVFLVINSYTTQERGKVPEKKDQLEWYSSKYKGPLVIAELGYVYNAPLQQFNATQPAVYFQKNPLPAPQPSNVKLTDEAKGFGMFPNPAKEVLNLKATNGIQSVHIFNIQGQEVILNDTSTGVEQLDISDLKNGIYIVRIINNNGKQASLKLLKN